MQKNVCFISILGLLFFVILCTGCQPIKANVGTRQSNQSKILSIEVETGGTITYDVSQIRLCTRESMDSITDTLEVSITVRNLNADRYVEDFRCFQLIGEDLLDKVIENDNDNIPGHLIDRVETNNGDFQMPLPGESVAVVAFWNISVSETEELINGKMYLAYISPNNMANAYMPITFG